MQLIGAYAAGARHGVRGRSVHCVVLFDRDTAWFRNVTQRGEQQRATPCKRLMTLFRDMLVGLTEVVLRTSRPLEVVAFD